MKTGRYTIFGNPVGHSKSPAMFRAAYAAYPGLTYDSNELASAEDCVALLKAKYDGANITAPFKEGVFRLADQVSDVAQLIGAVNMVRVVQGAIVADNCDHYGVSESFREAGVNLRNKSCLLLGIGGAGKAAAYAVSQAGAKLTIVNRTEAKAAEFAARLNCNYAPLSCLDTLASAADIIINTLYSNIDLVERQWLNSAQTVLDASYIGSPLLEKARNAGCQIFDGRYWVYHQALYCFRIFTGVEPDKKAMRQMLGLCEP